LVRANIFKLGVEAIIPINSHTGNNVGVVGQTALLFRRHLTKDFRNVDQSVTHETILSIAVLLVFIPFAWAHAFIDHAEPAVGSKLASPPGAVKIWFTERLESALSKIQVFDSQEPRSINRHESDPKNGQLYSSRCPLLEPEISSHLAGGVGGHSCNKRQLRIRNSRIISPAASGPASRSTNYQVMLNLLFGRWANIYSSSLCLSLFAFKRLCSPVMCKNGRGNDFAEERYLRL